VGEIGASGWIVGNPEPEIELVANFPVAHQNHPE
jgi:hypothetical protein